MTSLVRRGGGCSRRRTGDQPGGHLVGGARGASGVGSWVSPSGGCRARQLVQPKPDRHGRVCPADEQPPVGRSTGQRSSARAGDASCKEFGGQRFATTHARPRPACRACREALGTTCGDDSLGHRCGAWALSGGWRVSQAVRPVIFVVFLGRRGCLSAPTPRCATRPGADGVCRARRLCGGRRWLRCGGLWRRGPRARSDAPGLGPRR